MEIVIVIEGNENIEGVLINCSTHTSRSRALPHTVISTQSKTSPMKLAVSVATPGAETMGPAWKVHMKIYMQVCYDP